MKTMRVKRIVRRPGCRPVLYGDRNDYSVIADVPDSAFNVKVGDMISYEPDGVNYGWLVWE